MTEQIEERVSVPRVYMEMLAELVQASYHMSYRSWINTDLKDFGVSLEDMNRFQQAYSRVESYLIAAEQARRDGK